jgi:ABC-2 type transport system ATP-binding protein
MKQRLGIAQALLNRPKLLICDEPTSALDPVGRKEILDILLLVREQTTVLFSTHILSDVERVCTDVALLNNGVVEIQGSMSEIKTRFRTDGYMLETANEAARDAIRRAFPTVKAAEGNVLTLTEQDTPVFDVLRFVADQQIPLLKWERREPTLESLFMEVTKK